MSKIGNKCLMTIRIKFHDVCSTYLHKKNANTQCERGVRVPINLDILHLLFYWIYNLGKKVTRFPYKALRRKFGRERKGEREEGKKAYHSSTLPPSSPLGTATVPSHGRRQVRTVGAHTAWYLELQTSSSEVRGEGKGRSPVLRGNALLEQNAPHKQIT